MIIQVNEVIFDCDLFVHFFFQLDAEKVRENDKNEERILI